MTRPHGGEKLIASNRRAHHNFEILETYEAGLVLRGTEVKALRDGRADLKESYARVEREEVWLLGCHISPYAQGNRQNHDPVRPRKLLLHQGRDRPSPRPGDGERVDPRPPAPILQGRAGKVEIGLARGRKTLDKRHVIREREERREMQRAVRERARG